MKSLAIGILIQSEMGKEAMLSHEGVILEAMKKRASPYVPAV